MKLSTKFKKPVIILAVTLMLFWSTTLLWHIDLKDVAQTAVSGDINAAAQAIAGAGAAAILISIYINAAISIMGLLPSVFLTGANVLVFGLYGGFLVSWAGEVVGAAVSFLLYRWGIKSAAKIPTDRWKTIKTINALPGARQIYFLTILRMAPFMPSGLINLLGALTAIRLQNFILATTIGKFPALLLETAFMYNLLNINKGYINMVTGVLVAALLYWGVQKELQRLDKLHQNTNR
ncbi:TVP38/TMEM64 family inner membrane protein YdjZ [Sporotomaculum syntrophicum]|uniref:TVP38/TMEM64 family membrane protein n=1 Tax=Sporotomaculum syntrophicum TaxID=182264 RepID=A0A9D2WPZ7_9FIRM|nr:VTT domain-containing protein [Sporotomaculum syntrophicum]KAF1084801.1 TVP38/TMEM64 family inner membrane protein YdjZ [Sporotomaculum syntrophicum]